MRSRKCQLGVACSRETQRGREAHSARWTQSDGGLRRRCGGEGGDGEEGTERAEAQAGRAHGAGGEGFHLGLSRQFLPAHTQREKQACELEDDVRRVCAVCPGAMAAEVGRASGKGNPTPPTHPLRNRPTPFSTSFGCIHRSLLLCTPRRSHTELSLPTSLPQCSVGSRDPRRHRRLAWVPPPVRVLWPAPLPCA